MMKSVAAACVVFASAAAAGPIAESLAIASLDAPAVLVGDGPNGTVNLILDTGTSRTTLDSAFAPREGSEKSRIHGNIGKTAKGRRGPAPALMVLGERLDLEEPVDFVDLSVFDAGLGMRLDGFLGMDYLRRHIVQLDFERGIVRLLASGSAPAPEWGAAFTLDPGRALPVVEAIAVSSGGVAYPIQCVIDTGADSSGMLPEPVFSAVRYGSLRKIPGAVIAVGGEADVQRSRVAELRLGSFTYKSLIMDRGSSCQFGRGFLSRHLATFDFPGGRLYLKPNRHFSEIEAYDRGGVAVVRAGGLTRVLEVVKGSPGEKAGLKEGDFIETVDGRSASSLDLFSLRRRFRAEPGSKVALGMRRAGRKFEASLTLVPNLEP
jgi:hypothetical protein